MATWNQSEKAVIGDLKRHGDQIGELYGKVDDVDERIGKAETDLGGKMSSMDTKLDLIHSYSRGIILSILGAVLVALATLITH